MNKNELILYHGSEFVIEKPEFGKGKKHNDYGLGFYCTEDLDLAKEWAVDDTRNGFANKYSLDLSGLKILNLSECATVLNWITVLLQNRVFSLKNDITKQGREFLLEHYSLPVSDYDIIRGYRADDSYFAYAESFLNNTISVQRLSEALRLGNLGEQVVLKSAKAFGQIRFLGYEIADSAVYYPLRKERNMNARKEFLTNRRGSVSPDDLFLVDIMRGVPEDDPRIQ
jgi:hypothetical protein